MSFTLTHRDDFSTNAQTVSNTQSVTGDDQTNISTTIANGATNQEIVLGIDISLAKAVIIRSTQVLTIKTNSSSTPDDTITTVANIAKKWIDGGYDSIFLSADVTKIFVSNASGADATLQIIVLADQP